MRKAERDACIVALAVAAQCRIPFDHGQPSGFQELRAVSRPILRVWSRMCVAASASLRLQLLQCAHGNSQRLSEFFSAKSGGAGGEGRRCGRLEC